MVQLREWLIALSAADVSVMIALQRIEDAQSERTQPPDSLAPGVVALEAGGALFAYRVAVVDAQPKPPSKVRAHYELDQRLAAMSRARSPHQSPPGPASAEPVSSSVPC